MDLGAKRGCKGLFVSTLESEYNFRKCLGYFGMARGLKTFVRIQKKNHIRWSSDGGDSVGVPTRGSGSQLVNAACFLVPDDDARGNHSNARFYPGSGRGAVRPAKGVCEGTVLSCTRGACSRGYKRGKRGREAPKSLLEVESVEMSAQ